MNSAYSTTIHLQLQDTDFVTALALEISKRVRWVGKWLDLSKAYKQLPVHPSHRDLAVIFYKSPEGRTVFHVTNSMFFGSSAAVFAFNRISRSLRFLLCKELLVPSSVFYNDFPLFSPEESADERASELATQALRPQVSSLPLWFGRGSVGRQEAQSVHGLLRYAGGHFAGRQLLHLEKLPNPDHLKCVCDQAVALLRGHPDPLASDNFH